MIFLGLGSNIADREKNIIAAINALARHPRITILKVSSLYETAPVGYTNQSDFLNAVISIETDLSPFELLDACLKAEQDIGRVRKERWGPRIIDIDLLIYHDVVCHSEKLTLPHSRLHERSFVLVPLAEIAPTAAVHDGLTAGELLKSCPAEGVAFYKRITWEVN